jgi:hypothetical protein
MGISLKSSRMIRHNTFFIQLPAPAVDEIHNARAEMGCRIDCQLRVMEDGYAWTHFHAAGWFHL